MQRNCSPNRSGLLQQSFLITFLLAIAVDQISKFWVRSALSAGQSLPEGGLLRLTYLTNSGAALGLFAQQTLPLILCTLAAILALFLCYRYFLLNHPLARLGLALVVGGGIGNLVDRIWFGYVIDFIDFHWLAFNFADAAIVIGAGIIVYSLWKRKCLKHSASQ